MSKTTDTEQTGSGSEEVEVRGRAAMVELDVDASSKVGWCSWVKSCLWCSGHQGQQDQEELLYHQGLANFTEQLNSFRAKLAAYDTDNSKHDDQVRAKGNVLLVTIQDQKEKTTNGQQLQVLENCLRESIGLLTSISRQVVPDSVSCVEGRPGRPEGESFQQTVKKAPGNLPRWKKFAVGASVTLTGLLVGGCAGASISDKVIEHNTFDHLHLGPNETAVEWACVGVGGSTVLVGLSIMYSGLFKSRTGVSRAMMEFNQAVYDEQKRRCCGLPARRSNYLPV